MDRSNFKSDAQYKKYCDIRGYVKKLIDLQSQGKKIYKNGQLVTSKFFIDGEEIGETERFDNPKAIFTSLYIGCTHDLNPKTGEYDLLYIPYSLKKFKKENKFQIIDSFTDIV